MDITSKKAQSKLNPTLDTLLQKPYVCFTMRFHIETERLILRDILPSDAEAFFKMDSNPAVHTYLGNNPLKKFEDIHQVIANINQQYIDNGIGRWAAIEKASGQFIGWSGLKFIREPENKHVDFYDVGYRLSPEYWGKGYATESAKAALEYGFNKFQMNEIIGTTHHQNKASRHALEKCGLKYVEDFSWHDIPCHWLRISRKEWEDLQTSASK